MKRKALKNMTVTVKRSKDRKTEITCGDIEIWVGERESYMRGNGSRGSAEYLKTTRETFNALILCCQAAIEEIDLLEKEEIKELEERLEQLKGKRDIVVIKEEPQND